MKSLRSAGALKYCAKSDAPAPSVVRLHWREPDHGPALRVPPLKQARTARGHTFFGDTVVHHESELEQRVSTILRSYPDLLEIYSQYPKVQYVDAEGITRSHTFDFFIVLKSGRRVAVAVKYARKRLQMLELLEQIRAAGITGVGDNGKLTPGAADAVTLVTDAEATHEAFENALFIIASRFHHDDAEFAAMTQAVRRLPGRFLFGQLLAGAPSRAKRRTAIWRLIDNGIVTPLTLGRIDELTWLRVRS